MQHLQMILIFKGIALAMQKVQQSKLDSFMSIEGQWFQRSHDKELAIIVCYYHLQKKQSQSDAELLGEERWSIFNSFCFLNSVLPLSFSPSFTPPPASHRPLPAPPVPVFSVLSLSPCKFFRHKQTCSSRLGCSFPAHSSAIICFSNMD